MLDRLIVSPCFRLEPDLYDALASIQRELEEHEEAGASTVKPRTRVVVIDPINNLFKDTLMNTSAQGHAAMITVLEEIADLTYSRGLLSIVNTSSCCQSTRSAMGLSWF